MVAAQSRPSVFTRLRSNMVNGSAMAPSVTALQTTASTTSLTPAPSATDVIVSTPAPVDHLSLLESAIAQAQQTQTSTAAPAPVAAPVMAVPTDVVTTAPLAPALDANNQVTAAPGATTFTQPPLETVAQAVPTVIAQQTDTLNVPLASAAPKEVWKPPVAPVDTLATTAVPEAPLAQPIMETSAASSTAEQAGQPVVEAGAASGVVEFEPPSELPVEVEGYLQEVKDHADQLPQEIVIADNQVNLVTTPAQSLRPVVVLPITPELEKIGSRKNPSWSLRWLVEWSRKLMKAFTGKIIYRQTP